MDNKTEEDSLKEKSLFQPIPSPIENASQKTLSDEMKHDPI